MADAVILAAKDAGVRITLLRTAYLRPSFGQELTPAQRRFVDADVDHVMGDVDALRTRHAGDPRVRIDVAAHGIRAVPLPQVVQLAEFAAARSSSLRTLGSLARARAAHSSSVAHAVSLTAMTTAPGMCPDSA